MYSQQAGPTLPIILEHADSLVGTGQINTGTREFIGNVRFTQGNVTVKCDRATQYLVDNRADLSGNVVIIQQGAVVTAPFISYDGVQFIATAPRGLQVLERGSKIASRRGWYSTKTHIATFADSVRALDDSTSLWADALVYDRDQDTALAVGNVLLTNRDGSVVMAGDTGLRKPGMGLMRMVGSARLWQTDTAGINDTLLVLADTILFVSSTESDSFEAFGNASLVRGSVSAKAGRMLYSESTGRFNLYELPVLWSDSMLLKADTIIAEAPGRVLEAVIGMGNAILVSRTDTLDNERFDQIGGGQIRLTIQNDTVRRLVSSGSARSITFRTEDERREGLASVASDTIEADFTSGVLSDVYWLGGVEGEHHPEPVVSGRATTYRLPNFVWRTDRPRLLPAPKPRSMKFP